MAMSILYDDRGFRMKFGGIPRYFTEVMKRLPPDFVWKIAAQRTENLYLQQPPFNVPKARREFTRQDFSNRFLGGCTVRGMDRLWGIIRNTWPEVVRSDRVVNDRIFARMARNADIALVHLTEPHYFNYPWEQNCKGKKLIVTVHDLIPDMVWNYEWMRPYRKKVLERADAIIAVSNYTRDKILELYDVSPDKISVVYHGHIDYADQDDVQLFPDKRYILYVGKRNSYKNFPFFVQAIAPLIKEQKDLYLVCTGRDFSAGEKELFLAKGIMEKVVHVFVDDCKMRSLYSNAEVFVYPSLVEGFGIPILDAFAAKCPVVVSNCSCFPEIAKDAALYFDKGDEEGLRAAVNRLSVDRNLRSAMIASGVERLKSFSWQKCCDETVAVYKKVLA